MIVLLCLLVGLVVLLVLVITWLVAGVDRLRVSQHDNTIARMLDYARATALRDAAKAWDTVDAEADRKALSWTPDVRDSGKSLVEVWLNSLADDIDRGLLPADYAGSVEDEPVQCRKCVVSRNAGGGKCLEHR